MGRDRDRAGRRLTHDELKAAEAAFQGRSFSEAWSEAARTVYDGILAAKIKLNNETFMRELSVANRDLQGAEELVGAVAHCGGDEGFNGL